MHSAYVAQGDDTMVVEYAELVTDPLAVQQRYARFIGWQPQIPFDQFIESVPEGFATKALNGLAILFDTSNLTRWRQPKYRDRIEEILDELPELPALLIELGYESDTGWARCDSGSLAFSRSEPGSLAAPRHTSVRGWAFMVAAAAVVVTAVDAVLLERSKGYFRGGFLSIDHLEGPGQTVGRLPFFAASSTCSIAVVLAPLRSASR